MAKPKGAPSGLHKALAHPLRTAILLTMEAKGRCSPNQFSAATKGTDNEVPLNVVAYHFRALLRYEAIELAETIPRRGATEHVYQIDPSSQVLDLVRAADLLQQVTDVPLAEGLADAERVAILPLEVDDSGQRELQEIIAALKNGLIQLGENCSKRLSESAEPPIAVRVGIAMHLFHGPNWSPPPIVS